MRIYNTTKVTIVGKAEPTKSRDGNSTFYRIAVLQNGQATNLSVSEDAYYAVPSGITDAEFETYYDDQYKTFRVERLVQIITVNGSKPGSTAPGDKTAPVK